jgi:microcystin-dependent protein
MSDPFLAEIRITSFSFAPKGWALCNGQLLPINQNQALFALLGTNFGGDGRVNFGLPDLRGRSPLHFAAAYPLGQRAGSEAVALTAAQIPQHAHTVLASGLSAATNQPAGNVFAKKPRFGIDVYAPPGNLAQMSPAAIGSTGGSQPHDNMQPYLVLNFIIALQGIFPSQS